MKYTVNERCVFDFPSVTVYILEDELAVGSLWAAIVGEVLRCTLLHGVIDGHLINKKMSCGHYDGDGASGKKWQQPQRV